MSAQEAASADLRDAVSRIRWYHKMEIGEILTPGVSDTRRGLPRLQLPASFAGKSVLDVGAWDGFYSFEAARRGARRVLATDSFAWDGSCWGSQEGFLLARKALGFERAVDARTVDVLDICPEELGGTFDVTLFLGVLYHLRDPVTAIERVASVTRELLVLETETAFGWLGVPAARVYPAGELNQDDTNYFALNRAALEGLLRRVGFTTVRTVYRSSVARRLARSAWVGARGAPVRSAFRSARIVLHARRGAATPSYEMGQHT
ncbi:MAG: class I SAM-dependent methyltransferase [Acidimicrobiales bacterium]